MGRLFVLFLCSAAIHGFAAVDPKRGVVEIDGAEYPAVGFGTFPLWDEVCTDAVSHAADSGCRIIDTATFYCNFSEIAKALEKQDRSRFYLISKVWHDMVAPKNLKKDLERTLKLLQTDYLDAYLVHWPNSEMPIEKTLLAMDALRREKKIRHIGLSNVTVNHLKRALECSVPITWVQVEMNPKFYDPALLAFCKEHSILVQAWAPLGTGRLSQDPLLEKIGKQVGKTPSQVALRWIIQHGCVPLPNSRSEAHIRENLAVADFVLSEEQVEEIDERAKSGRRRRVTKEMLDFSDEFDYSYEQCWPKQ